MKRFNKRRFGAWLTCLCIAAMAAFSTFPARAEEMLLTAETLEAILLSAAASDGQMTLTAKWINHAATEETVLLFAPTLDEQPAAFRHGWPSEEIILPPTSETETSITLYADDPQMLAQTASFRFIHAGKISSLTIVNAGEGGQLQQSASFSPDAEPSLVEPCVQWPSSAPCVTLEDSLSPEQLALLAFGQLQVCLRRVEDGQEFLIPFATVPADISPDGKATAHFCGNAVVCSAAPDFPLLITETHDNGHCAYTVSDIMLSGPFVFYSMLEMTLETAPQAQTVTLARLALDSLDTGDILQSPPLCIFDMLSLSLPVYQMAPQENTLLQFNAGVHSTNLPLDAPLSFQLVSAGSLGEIVAYFEYFFTDQTDVIHPVIPLY